MNKIILIVGVILIVIIGGYFLLKGDYQASVPTVSTPPITTEEIRPAPEEVIPPKEEAVAIPAIKEFTVSGTEFRFNPSLITVSAGDLVKITFRNDGRAPHNLVIKELGISTKTIGGGETDTIEFAAPASGAYTFICSVPGHATAGMVGDLIVK